MTAYLQPSEWQFSDKITAGVEYLNEQDPLWYEKVDLQAEDFNMRDAARDAVRRAGGDPDDIPQGLGFFAELPLFDPLNREWRQTIKSLRTRPDWADLPATSSLLVQNAGGAWCDGDFEHAEPDTYSGWRGEPIGGSWGRPDTAEIPNPAWRATLTHCPETFVVGATYEMLADDCRACRPGETFTVARIDKTGDAWTPDYCVSRGRLSDNEVRLVSLPNQKEAIVTTQEAYRVLFEDFKSRVPVGSTVRIVRKWTDEEAQRWGIHLRVNDFFKWYNVGDEVAIRSYSRGLFVSVGEKGSTPITCLEVVSTKPAFQTVKLNGHYEAKVYKDKIVVGCQEFPCGVIGDLLRAHMKVINP